MKSKKVQQCIQVAIGRNIRALRRRAGLTIKDLAERVGIQPEPLGNLERGRNAPSARVVHGLAHVLGVSVDTLFAMTPEDFRAHCEESSVQPFPVLPDSRPIPPTILRLADRLCADCLALEDLCAAQKHATIPLRVHLEADEPGMLKLAATVRDFMDIRNGIVFDYFELFETCSFRVVVLPLADDLDSFSYFDPGNENALFFINPGKTPERQLFSLAFELGLLYLRSAPRTPAMPSAAIAHLARKFAAFFLMPAAAVRKTVAQLGVAPDRWNLGLLLRIKHRFGVSAETFLYRLRELECVDEIRYEEIKAAIYLHYQRSQFVEPDASRRLLTPNGRLWDLLMVAAAIPAAEAEAKEIQARLLQAGLPR